MNESQCKVAVVGAGWSGAYFGWRLAVDSGAVNASSMCVFESYGRVGGRIDSIHDLPGFDDLAVDLGGYRFIETDLLPAQLVWRALKLPTACYDWECSGGCEGASNCYVIKDVYGNNAGYATPIETMLGQIENQGVGQQIFFGYSVESVDFTENGTFTIGFGDGAGSVSGVETVLLAAPKNAIANISFSPQLLGPIATAIVKDRVRVSAMNKVYAFYKTAWWNTLLGLMEGSFEATASDNVTAPLQGRYHDGPQKCIVGTEPNGNPIYSGDKVQYGDCAGAIEAYYAQAVPFYRQFMVDELTPITVVTDDDHLLKRSVHKALMDRHAEALSAVGVNASDIALPVTVILSNWIEDGHYTPGIGFFEGTNEGRKLARNPSAGKAKLFVANQDYGYKSGWANGGLLMAEKILQANLGIPGPTWLDEEYYQERVRGVP